MLQMMARLPHGSNIFCFWEVCSVNGVTPLKIQKAHRGMLVVAAVSVMSDLVGMSDVMLSNAERC